MDRHSFNNFLLKDFPYDATLSQITLLDKLSGFVLSDNKAVFLLKGYAGTGKTTIISDLVKNLWKVKKNYILLAPTGRAAKVMASYAQKTAFTIHKHLYYPKIDSFGKLKFTIKKNKQKNTVFIVDEASMISGVDQGDSIFSQSSLLSDLISFVYQHESNKLILVGDTAQLPPVGTHLSPALDKNYLQQNFDIDIQEYELDEVVRQSFDSGILFNATKIREELKYADPGEIKFNDMGFDDFVRLDNGYDIQDAIEQAYSGNIFEETAIIVRSNKRANMYNQQIRNKILLRENELDAGDNLMVVKNNYFWLDDSSVAGFIANGDVVEILEIYKFIDLYDFHFAEARIKLVDYPNEKPIDTVLLLDTLHTETPSLSYEQSNKLYHAVNEDYEHLKTKWQRYKKVKENKYFNALQVKFAYALTCHKAQGGQWNNVFIEQPYKMDLQDKEQLRWLYTAFTRAQKKLYLMGFNEQHFIE
jgi:ATP-dependent exoDNAse (exonuclease V) alpha subunit